MGRDVTVETEDIRHGSSEAVVHLVHDDVGALGLSTTRLAFRSFAMSGPSPVEDFDAKLIVNFRARCPFDFTPRSNRCISCVGVDRRGPPHGSTAHTHLLVDCAPERALVQCQLLLCVIMTDAMSLVEWLMGFYSLTCYRFILDVGHIW